MTSEAKNVVEATAHPCSACPWRTENHHRKSPGKVEGQRYGWYSQANRSRLWAQLRRGDSMTCHPTDPTNPVPPGHKAVPEDATTHECAGAVVLQQREVHRFNMVLEAGGTIADYRRKFRHAMTRDGLAQVVWRFMVGGQLPGTRGMPRPDLREPVAIGDEGIEDLQ